MKQRMGPLIESIMSECKREQTVANAARQQQGGGTLANQQQHPQHHLLLQASPTKKPPAVVVGHPAGHAASRTTKTSQGPQGTGGQQLNLNPGAGGFLEELVYWLCSLIDTAELYDS